jgi:predicted DNA-binding transcriptional regulator AlpA
MRIEKRWLTPEDLELELGIAKSTQAKLRMDRKIPFVKMTARRVIYDRLEIESWLLEKKVETIQGGEQ